MSDEMSYTKYQISDENALSCLQTFSISIPESQRIVICGGRQLALCHIATVGGVQLDNDSVVYCERQHTQGVHVSKFTGSTEAVEILPCPCCMTVEIVGHLSGGTQGLQLTNKNQHRNEVKH